MTREILVQMLATLDSYELFSQSNGSKNFLLLDGHPSRLELPFLEYINQRHHEWCVCIGVPYGTAFWQVGDSSEQNRSYKMYIVKAKGILIKKGGKMSDARDSTI